MNSFLRLLVAIVAFGASMAHAAGPSIVGAWELIHVAPADVLHTTPAGVTNMKLSFGEDGQVRSLQPDETSVADAKTTTYTFDGQHLRIGTIEMQVAFPDLDTMSMRQGDAGQHTFASQRTFKRLASFEQRLEPRSLQLVEDPTVTPRVVAYDTQDYSRQPLRERVRGTWEVMAWQNVPRGQVPPYGFFNDLYTVTADRVTVLRRDPRAIDSVPIALADGHLATSGIGLGGSVGSKIEWTPSFDEWGHLVLDSTFVRLVLKLVTKDTSAVPEVPLQVVVLRMRS